MIETPLVTIYIPTKNRVNLLRRAVKSALNQDYENIEVIVIDDGSTDDTIEYLSKESQNDCRLKYKSNPKSLGACTSRNLALSMAKGKFITGLDDDDYFLNNRISDFLKSWPKNDTNIVGLYSNSLIITSNSKKKEIKRPKSTKKSDLIHSNQIGNQIFTKTSILRSINGFDKSLPAWQDLDCWYRALHSNESIMIRTNNTTYVIDQSHPHERISTSKHEKIKLAAEIFSHKHNLNKPQRDFINLQLRGYDKEKPSLAVILKRIANKPTYSNVKSSIWLIVNSK